MYGTFKKGFDTRFRRAGMRPKEKDSSTTLPAHRFNSR
jgi:hypothetical protein